MLDLIRLLERASGAFGSIGGANAGMPRRIWDELSPWMGRFVSSTTEKWLPMLLRGEACSLPRMQDGVPLPCHNHACAPCDCCHRPVCIHHARVDQYGDAICYLCVLEVYRLKNVAPPPGVHSHAGPRAAPPIPADVVTEIVTKALKRLGLKRGATWEEVRLAHRKLSGKHHPDRVQGEAEKKNAEDKFKKVQVAFQDLERHYRASAEAKVA